MTKITSLILLIFFLFIGFLLSVLPIKVPDGIDKIYHFAGFYSVTVFSIYVITKFFGKKKINSYFVFILIIGAGLATLSELIQDGAVLRNCNSDDWITNLAGVGSATLVMYLSNLRLTRKLELFDQETSENL
ncbi:MAG: hypothetical protein ACD_20C00087G0009 [uncultured bacterium]|nr:MAG: hypothetical protein ACD_20C00087G0009 [uncultured bacterium]